MSSQGEHGYELDESSRAGLCEPGHLRELQQTQIQDPQAVFCPSLGSKKEAYRKEYSILKVQLG